MEKTETEFLQRIIASPADEKCPIRKSLDLFSSKWRTWVLFELCKQPTYRFGELRKAIPPITNTMLTKTLRELEAIGIIQRKQFNEMPLRVEYSLTESGHALTPVFFEIAKWADQYLPTEN
ncbi:winged helix-turn-helix transcriptional regulator [Lapidilactobacillus bayanensis]|uniref:winged helix-turn-helix transcriptional regulator n=1 Tax=Lapidilactobacillus bayanensis TaxID=2485998 RepID=UPI000F7B736E|nr:helix-turn-helix domain-containing protein [Lapidilactobacillus bayanensis]